MSNTHHKTNELERKRNGFPLPQSHGILQPEMFAVKSMDVNSNLLRLKLDMVYRDLPMEEAQKRFSDATIAPQPQAVEPQVAKPKGVRRKVVKALVVKSK